MMSLIDKLKRWMDENRDSLNETYQQFREETGSTMLFDDFCYLLFFECKAGQEAFESIHEGE